MRALKILNKPLLQVKKYWSILKTFYSEKKISMIPPLLIGKKFVTDIKKKVNIFNNFFVEECTQSLTISIKPGVSNSRKVMFI